MSKDDALGALARKAMQLEMAVKHLDQAAQNFRASMRQHGREDFLKLASLSYDNASPQEDPEP